MKRLFFLLALTIPASLPALPVTTYDDEPDNGGSIEDEFEDGNGLSLREAIGLQNRALTDDPIRFDSFLPLPSGTAVTITLTSGEIPITAPVEVQNSLIDDLGERVPITIDAGGTSRHLAIAMNGTGFPAVIFQEAFHFTNGFAEGDGGSIHISGSLETQWINCRFTANSATGSGGAIYLDSNTHARFDLFEESAVLFEDCHASLHGGAISASADASFQLSATTTGCTAGGNGGAFHATGGRIETFNTSITDCEATSGGALWIDGGVLILSATTLSTNSATADGGAVYAKSVEFESFESPVSADRNTASRNGGAFFLEDTTATNQFDASFIFTNNTAGAAGGGLYATASELLEIHMSGSGNTANGPGGGGALFLDATTIQWSSGSIFSGNQATAGPGGAIHIMNNSSFQAPLSFPLVFQDNTASGDGGALKAGNGAIIDINGGSATGNRSLAGNGGAFATDSESDLFLFEFTLSGNSAALSGGAFYTRSDGGFSACHFRENTAGENGGGACFDPPEDAQEIPVYIGESLFEKNVSGASGGGLFTRDVALNLNGTFRDNTAVADGGGLAVTASEFSFGAEIQESNITATGNSGSRGGGLFFGVGINTNGSLQISEISNNEASFQGGGIWIGGESQNPFFLAKPDEGLAISRNRCTGIDEGAGGGGLYVTGTSLLLEASQNYEISHNTSARDGGGILLAQSKLDGSPNFIENTAARNGGGLATNDGLFLRNVTFRKNSAASGGGAHVSQNQFATIERASFEENTATGEGGALAIDGGLCSILGTRFQANSARSGGALAIDGGLCSIVGTRFQANSARSGGAVAFAGERIEISEYSQFIENAATHNGGAISIAASDGSYLECQLVDSFFSQCSAGKNGGALALSGALNSTFISTCAFDTCSAESGGAIAHETTESSLPLEVRHSGFINNTTTLDGGAAALTGHASADFIQCSLTENSARNGGAISGGAESSLSLVYTTVGWNHATADGGGISADGSIIIKGSTIYGNIADARGGGIHSSGNQYRFDEAIIAKNSAPEFPDAKTEVTEPGSTFIITDPSGTSGGTVADPLLLPERGFFAEIPIESSDFILAIPNSRLIPHAQSPAIDAGPEITGNGNGTDQRWELETPRVVNGRIDFGSVEFQGAPTFATWAEASISNPALRAETADADGDGISNALEQLFGTDPTTVDPSPFEIVATPEGATLTYPLGNVPTGSDSVQWSTNLTNWNTNLPAGSMRRVATDPSNASRVIISTTLPPLTRAFFVIGTEN